MFDPELLRANRTFRVVFPLVVLLLFIWLSRRNTPREPLAPRLSLVELERRTDRHPFVTLFGRQGRHYRFETPDGRAYLVDRAEVQPALDQAMERMPDGAGVFVKVKGGRITAPDPRAVSEWFAREGGGEPLAEPAVVVGPPRPRVLPVVRHTHERQPTLLVLTSDGDWSDADLARLGGVLNDWIETDLPDLGPPLRDAERPQLWYDAAHSAGDRKAIVVRVRNFDDAWCEPLARRLGEEYPFLWQMDVGDRPGPVLRPGEPMP